MEGKAAAVFISRLKTGEPSDRTGAQRQVERVQIADLERSAI